MTISEDKAIEFYELLKSGIRLDFIAKMKEVKPSTIRSYALIGERAFNKKEELEREHELIDSLVERIKENSDRSFLDKLRDLLM